MACVDGIDVSAKSLDVVVRKQGKNGQSAAYGNSHSAHNEFTSKLKKLNPDLIVMEATGVYHFAIAERLFDEGLPVSVINPKQSFHFAKTLLQRSKTDAIDAGLIAEYGSVWSLANGPLRAGRAVSAERWHINLIASPRS